MKTPIKQQGRTCTATERKQLMCKKKKKKDVTKEEVKAETICYNILLKFSIASVTFWSSV